MITPGYGEGVRGGTGVIAVGDLHMEPVSVQKLNQDDAGVGRGEAVEDPEGVEDRGHRGVVCRVDVQLPEKFTKKVQYHSRKI